MIHWMVVLPTSIKMHPLKDSGEPALPISEEASIITGISDQMVSGKSIDEEQVQALVEQTDLIFAHNAYFDRVMVEKHWPCFPRNPGPVPSNQLTGCVKDLPRVN